MNQKLRTYLCITLLAIIALLIGSYFSVRGSEIDGIAEMSGSCTVKIVKYRHMEYENRTEYILNEDQITQLKELILKTSFTRVLSTWVTFDDLDQYDILIDFNNMYDYISIHSLGNEYICITDQFDGKHLKIRNPDWKAGLEQIISSTP